MFHQAVLAPVSEVLREMFLSQCCGHVRSMVHISIDCDPEVLQSILILIYNGKTYLSTTAVDKMKAIVKMLGLKFPGGFDRNELAKGFKPPVSSLFKVTSKSGRPRSGPSSMTKRPRERSEGSLSGGGTPSPALKKTKPSPQTAPARVSATERMNLHISMTMKLSNADPGKSIPCEIPGCGAQVTYDQLSSHFLNHETSASGSSGASPASLPCVACGLSFKSRGELDTHTKTRHGGATSLKEKLNLLSDSSDDEDSFDHVSETASVRSPARSPARSVERRKEPQRCDKCDSVFPSVLHLKAHSCSAAPAVESIKCDTCFKGFKTNKALAVHSKNAHKGGSPALDFKSEKVSPNKKYQCQICTKRFMEFRQLRTHYTLYHFWDNLAEDYKSVE